MSKLDDYMQGYEDGYAAAESVLTLAALLEQAGAQRMVLRTEAGRELAGYEMWLLAAPKEGEE